MNIDKIRNIGLDKLVTQVYDFDGLTTDELMCKFAQKINIIIEHFNYLDKTVQNKIENINLKLEYLTDQGLDEQVSKTLRELIDNGTFGNLINQTLFKDINKKVDDVKTEVDVERKRIDAFTSLTEGSTTGDAELIDIRIANNGIKYTNAGSSVREQVKNLENGGINDNSINPIKTSFITNNSLFYKSRHIWQTSEQSSYGTSDIIVENLSLKKPLYIKIGNSDCVDKATCVAVVKAYSNDYQNGETECGSTTINSTQLGEYVTLPNNDWTIHKVIISLYSSFETIIEAGTITTVTDIVLKDDNNEVEYTLNNIKVNKTDIVDNEYTIVTVKADGTGDFTNPLTATNQYFDDTINGLKKVLIQIYPGEYDIYGAWEEENKTGWYITGLNVGWNINSNIKLVGVGDVDKIICKCLQPDNTEYATKGSCINMNWGGEIENITFIAKNSRYTCHADNSNYYKNLKYSIKNCVFKHLGNAIGLWQWHGAWMEGSSSGNEYLFEECEFYGVRGAYGTHTNTNFDIPSIHRFKNCKFFNDDESVGTVNFESLGSGVKNRSYLEGCYIQRSIGLVANGDVDIDMELMGHGNSRVTINNPKNAKTYFTDM